MVAMGCALMLKRFGVSWLHVLPRLIMLVLSNPETWSALFSFATDIACILQEPASPACFK